MDTIPSGNTLWPLSFFGAKLLLNWVQSSHHLTGATRGPFLQAYASGSAIADRSYIPLSTWHALLPETGGTPVLLSARRPLIKLRYRFFISRNPC
jgi:hypothetical protein